TLERAQGFGLGVAGGHATLQVGAGVIVAADLGDGDAVDGGVDLAVAGAGEAVSLPVAGPHRQRCGAVVGGVGVLGAETAHVRGLSDDLGGGEHTNSGQCQQGRGQLGDQGGDVAFEGPFAPGQAADISDDVGSDAGDGPV